MLFVSIAAVSGTAAEKDQPKFNARPVGEYPHRQTSEKVTIAAQPFETDEEAREAFGKVNPYRLGILPVLIVIQNDGPDAVRLDAAKFIYVLPDRTRVEAVPARELKTLHGARKPPSVAKPTGGISIGKLPKNPLGEWEIEGRALAVQMLPPGQSASGFVYFEVPQSSQAASVYISGLMNAVTRNELYYFEIPMSGK